MEDRPGHSGASNGCWARLAPAHLPAGSSAVFMIIIPEAARTESQDSGSGGRSRRADCRSSIGQASARGVVESAGMAVSIDPEVGRIDTPAGYCLHGWILPRLIRRSTDVIDIIMTCTVPIHAFPHELYPLPSWLARSDPSKAHFRSRLFAFFLVNCPWYSISSHRHV